jgi:hypothetical protein
MTRYADECREIMDGEDERKAVNVLVEAMGAPIMNIADNAGVLGALVREKESRSTHTHIHAARERAFGAHATHTRAARPKDRRGKFKTNHEHRG